MISRHVGENRARLFGVSSRIRIVTVSLLAVMSLALGIGGAQAAPAVPAKVMYPMPPRAVPEQLRPAAQAALPRIAVKTTRIIGDAMDQSALTPVQIVSAWHIRSAFRKMGAPAFRSAVRIAWRESRLLPNVVNDTNKNGTNDWGLFQLNDGGTLQFAGGEPGESVLRPRWNARAAARIVADVGWGPWGGMLGE